MSSRACQLADLVHSWLGAPQAEYAYLLGMDLGDGCISRAPRTQRLRITLDRAYPAIIEECRAAVAALMPERSVALVQRTGCVDIPCYSVRWPDLLPVGAWQISVARRDSVARLSEFLGPKA